MKKKRPAYTQIQKGTLLIASPDIDSGMLFRSLVLICEHNSSGSFGIVINKPLEVDLPQSILNVENLNNPHVHIRAGGPLQTNQLMLLHTSNEIPEQTLTICEDVYLGGDLNFLQEALSDENGPQIDLCFGYIGWGGGILEREFLDGNWFIAPSSKRYVFDIEPEKLWQKVLQDMGGKYAGLSQIPEDLSVN